MDENSKNPQLPENEELNKTFEVNTEIETNDAEVTAISAESPTFQNDSTSDIFSEDDFVIGKGFQLEEIAEDNVKKKKHKKKRSVVKTVIWLAIILIVSISLAFGVIYAVADFSGIAFGRGEEITIEIKSGSTVDEITAVLEDTGAVKIPFLFKTYAKFKGYDSQFKYGVYTFKTDSGYSNICDMLINEGAKAETVTVTIPEGTGINDYTKNVNGEKVTVKGIATILEEKNVCTRADFLAALDEVKRESKLLSQADDVKTYHTLEGYLFPETYDFYSYDSKECARLAVKKILKVTEEKITDEMFKRADELGYSMNEILTMASIIQMESGRNTKQMAGVASVFYNRLKSDEFATLGSSPTCYYGKSFKYDDGRYDTYTAKGLPPGPLCSPGIDAINAALYPKKSDYYYFVTDSDGNFYYHKTLAEQNATIAKLQQGEKWIYEYFD